MISSQNLNLSIQGEMNYLFILKFNPKIFSPGKFFSCISFNNGNFKKIHIPLQSLIINSVRIMSS